jgi:hypothetical protein
VVRKPEPWTVIGVPLVALPEMLLSPAEIPTIAEVPLWVGVTTIPVVPLRGLVFEAVMVTVGGSTTVMSEYAVLVGSATEVAVILTVPAEDGVKVFPDHDPLTPE